MVGRIIRRWGQACGMLSAILVFVVECHAVSPPNRTCTRVTIEGEVSAGRQWRAALGQGWVFRVLPIAASLPEYSGWDLVVDREQAAGYPDALLLATLPYNSINEREIGTTFGLRAQDAIGWNPRSFRFLSNPAEFKEAQRSFLELNQSGFVQGSEGKPGASKGRMAKTLARLLELEKGASDGEFRILDAHIVPGVADPMPFAQAWALAASKTPHEIEDVPANQASERGRLQSMRFRLTLWLPGQWNAPPELGAVKIRCPE
jgi:hypothetical protein